MGIRERLKEWLGANGQNPPLGEASPAEETLERLRVFHAVLIESGVAKLDEIVGCSEEEIRALEEKYSIELPASYRWYLSEMGKQSGRLFTHDHLDVFYSDVFGMTERRRSDIADYPEEQLIQLPQDALIIAGRLGEQFQFIRCGSSDDSPVWYFGEWDENPTQSHSSVIYWLYTFLDEAEAALKNGLID